LAAVDLSTYAERIRSEFHIEEIEPIDFEKLETITPEIERRRALLRYFIPDIFMPGKYNRREDIIDGCIYYLDFMTGKGNQLPIYESWIKRAQCGRKFRFKDVEEGPYGFETYHPIWNVIGNPNNPTLIIPNLVKYIHCFKDRKLKLDINDYSLIFFSIFNSTPPSPVDAKLLKFTHYLQQELGKPLLEGLELKTLVEQMGFKDAKTFLAKFNKSGFKVANLFERSAFGLSHFILQFQYPNHYMIRFKGVNLTQNFLMGGRDYTQEIYLNLPSDAAWKFLVDRLPPNTQIYLGTKYRTPLHSPLTYFNLLTQDWDIPWDQVTKEWNNLLKEPQDSTPVEPDYDFIMPDESLLRVVTLLEENPLILNSEINARTKIPLEKVKALRKTLEEGALVSRAVFYYHLDMSEYVFLDVPGNEAWKYKILAKLGEIFPSFWILQMENLMTSKKSLRAGYLHKPIHINAFIKYFRATFNNAFPYKLHLNFLRISFHTPYQESFDSKAGTWNYNPKDYEIRPVNFRGPMKRGRFKA